MKRIALHLWFDNDAKEAVEFYLSAFPDSKLTGISALREVPTPDGHTDILNFEISEQPFVAINAGPLFTFNPSISFIVNFDPSRDDHARDQLNKLWATFSQGGTALMPLQEYPFSKWYGWIQDRFGISWQLMLTDPEGDQRPFIIPSLMYTGDVSGKAEEASDFYLSVFDDSKRGLIARYPAGMEPDKEGSIMFTDFRLSGSWFAAMDSAREHLFGFNEAISLLVPCDTQEEIDFYWDRLSADPEAEQCGWLKDAYGVSWQVWPTAMGEMMREGSPDQIARLTEAFLPMKKFDIAALEKAFNGSTG